MRCRRQGHIRRVTTTAKDLKYDSPGIKSGVRNRHEIRLGAMLDETFLPAALRHRESLFHNDCYGCIRRYHEHDATASIATCSMNEARSLDVQRLHRFLGFVFTMCARATFTINILRHSRRGRRDRLKTQHSQARIRRKGTSLVFCQIQ